MSGATLPDTALDRNLDDSSIPRRYRLTAGQYHQLADVGVFNEDSRVELIEGDLIAMPPIGECHASTTRRLNQLFSRQVGDTALVDVQNPVVLNANSEPQPDIVLLDVYRRPSADGYREVLYPALQETIAPVLLPQLSVSVECLWASHQKK